MASIPERNKEWLHRRSYAWEPNPELRYVWVSSTDKAIDNTFRETIDEVIALVQKLPVMYAVDESFIQDMTDNDMTIHRPGVNTISRDTLIEHLERMKSNGNG